MLRCEGQCRFAVGMLVRIGIAVGRMDRLEGTPYNYSLDLEKSHRENT